ncbi:rRNA maturation RNase YbeY [Nitrospirota bacterium]
MTRVIVRNTQRKVSLSIQAIERESRKALRTLGVKDAELSILFASPQKVRSLNHQYRGIDKTTDVLSFAVHDLGGKPPFRRPEGEEEFLLGDIVINPRRAEEQAKEYEVTLKTEIRRLIVHGLLHLLGYDHEAGAYQARKMVKKEEEVLEAINA